MVITNKSIRERRRAERDVKRQIADYSGGGQWGQTLRTLAPWLLLITAIILAPLARVGAVWGRVEGFTAVCLAAAGVVLLWVSLHLTRGRLTLGRAHELFNVTTPVAVIAYTVAFGVSKHVVIGAGIFGATSAIIWHRRHASSELRELERSAGGDHGGGGSVPARWREFVDEHMPTLADSQITVLKDDETELAVGLDLGEHGIPSDFTDTLIERFTRFAGGIAGGTSVVVGEKLDRIGIRAMRKDPLKTPFNWGGPSAPGASIMEPIGGLGFYRDGAPLELWLPHVPGAGLDGNDKPLSHLSLIGMSRAGKGEAGEEIDINVMLRRDSAVVLCDPVKADQQLGVIGEGAVYVLDNPNKIRSFMHRLVNVTIPARSSFLGNPTRNLLGRISKEWEPGCGLVWLMVHVYEGAALYNNQDLTKVAERAASCGVQLVFEAQRMIHDRVDTSLRANFGDMIVFGCNDPDDARLILPEELLDLGVDPSVWRNKRAGMCYTILSQLSLSRQVLPGRFARKAKDGSDIAASLTEYGHLGGQLDPVTAATFGDPYERWAAERAAKRGRAPKMHTFAAGPPAGRYAGQQAPELIPGAVLIEERPAVMLPPGPTRRSAPLDPADEGFDLSPEAELDDGPAGEDDERDLIEDLTAEARKDALARMGDALLDDPEAAEVLRLAAEAAEYGDNPLDGSDQDAPAVVDDIEFPDDPDEAHFTPIVDRNEALDVLLSVLRDDIGEGKAFRPSDLYDALDKRARRSDSWVRRCMKTLQEWGCIREAENYGEYEVIHTRRPDPGDYTE